MYLILSQILIPLICIICLKLHSSPSIEGSPLLDNSLKMKQKDYTFDQKKKRQLFQQGVGSYRSLCLYIMVLEINIVRAASLRAHPHASIKELTKFVTKLFL